MHDDGEKYKLSSQTCIGNPDYLSLLELTEKKKLFIVYVLLFQENWLLGGEKRDTELKKFKKDFNSKHENANKR